MGPRQGPSLKASPRGTLCQPQQWTGHLVELQPAEQYVAGNVAESAEQLRQPELAVDVAWFFVERRADGQLVTVEPLIFSAVILAHALSAANHRFTIVAQKL